jgi:hypothetical protein
VTVSEVPETPEDVLTEEEPEEALSPYDLPGDWYVVHSYSGYENKVKVNLETRMHSMHMEDRIFEVVIPMEDVVEIKNGKKVTVPRKMFRGTRRVSPDSWDRGTSRSRCHGVRWSASSGSRRKSTRRRRGSSRHGRSGTVFVW